MSIFNQVLALEGEATTTSGVLGGGMWTWVVMAIFLGGMYFLMIRPQNKRDKEQREMRSNVEIGDGVTTIGGIIGRVVSIKDETILLETGSDRVKIRLQKWAIQSVEKLKLDE